MRGSKEGLYWILFSLMIIGFILNLLIFRWHFVILFTVLAVIFYKAAIHMRRRSEAFQYVPFALGCLIIVYGTLKAITTYFSKDLPGMDLMIKHSIWWDSNFSLVFATVIYVYFTFLMFSEMKRGREITTIPIIVADVHDRDKLLKTNDYNVKNIVLTVMNDSNFIIEKIRPKLTIIFNKKAYPLLTFDEIPFLNPKEIIDQHIGKEIIDFFNVEKYLETSHFLQKKTKDKWKTIPYEEDKQVNGWMPADVVHPKTRKIGPIETGSLKFELILDLQFKSLYSDRVHHLKDMFSFEWVYSLQDGNPESRIIKSSKRFGWNLRRKNAL